MPETFLERYAERLEREHAALEKRVEELADENAELKSQVVAASRGNDGLAELWRGRAADLRATINGIVTDPESSRQDVQSKLLLAMQRNEW